MQRDEYADHLLECAKFYHRDCPEFTLIPDSYVDEEQLFQTMRTMLLHDAHHKMRNSIEQPPSMFLNGIDLDTEEPGILHGETVQRSTPNVNPVAYGRINIPPQVPNQCVNKTITTASAMKLEASAVRRVEQCQAKAEAKAAYELMDKDEKKAIREQNKAMREQKKIAREQRKAEKATQNGESEIAPPQAHTVGDDDGVGVEEVGMEAIIPTENTEVAHEVAPAPKRDRDAAEVVQRPLDSVRRLRKRTDVTKIFESPASHDRHLVALTHMGLHHNVRDTMLSGTPSEHVQITDGPPGTGKTTALLNALEVWLATHPGERAFVCAPTNVGAADLFARALRRSICGVLSLSKEHMPPDAPRLRNVDIATARIVFATVAGRAAPRLIYQEFTAVFIDEAAHLIEAHALGLVRPAVATLYMAGDVAQLPALVSEESCSLGGARSLVERLLFLGVTPERLIVQHRMHPSILDFPNRLAYNGRLVTAQTRPTVPVGCESAPYRLYNVDGLELQIGTSRENTTEAERVIHIAKQCVDQGLKTVILAPYQGQVRRLLAFGSGIPVYTVDAYQGKESEAVVLSVVRTRASGFWEDARRLTVALTRAQHVLAVCMNADAWRSSPTPLGEMVRDADARGVISP